MFKWTLALMTGLILASYSAHADSIVPLINDDPPMTETLDRDMFDFVSKTLGAGKMASHMACTLKTHNGRELRKFSSGSEWVEYLEVDFNSSEFDGGRKTKFKIPMGAKYGVKKATNQWSAIGEDIKIELGDRYGHWIKFTHDGQGRLIQLQLGDDLSVNPCSRR